MTRRQILKAVAGAALAAIPGVSVAAAATVAPVAPPVEPLLLQPSEFHLQDECPCCCSSEIPETPYEIAISISHPGKLYKAKFPTSDFLTNKAIHLAPVYRRGKLIRWDGVLHIPRE
jgi:hypothetical protein